MNLHLKMRNYLNIKLAVFIFSFVYPAVLTQNCNLNQSVIDDIQSYQPVVDQIIDFFLNGPYKGQTYDRLAYFTDTFGPRHVGTDALEDAIDYVIQESISVGFSNVHGENVEVPIWERNEEKVEMLTPRQENLRFLSMGNSVGTPLGGIEAEVFVVTSFEDLEANQAQVPGKIVLYDYEYQSYGHDVTYRSDGAVVASMYGAVGTLIRSVTDFSIDSPHTGTTYYNDTIAPEIPIGAITVEDAAMLHRMQDRGEIVTVRMMMNATSYPNSISRNAVMEVVGQTTPSEVVVVGGHIDSWDVGEGVMDNGGGVMISWLAGMAVMEMGLPIRRTLRTVLFTAEEVGLVGGEAYYAAHMDNSENFQLMLESDGGLWTPYGLGFNGTDDATCMMQEILNLMSSIDATGLWNNSELSDMYLFKDSGVPTASPMIDRSRYFWFHHTDGDSMEVVTPEELDACAALWTAVAYVAADMTYRLPADIDLVDPVPPPS